MDKVTNNLSASVPVFYKYTEVSEDNLAQTQQAFTMHLNMYLLLRRFLFYLIKKQLVILPADIISSYQARGATMSEEVINPSSPIPITTPREETVVVSPDVASALTAVMGVVVDESGEDVEFERVVNQPSIAVAQKVEISRLNRYLSCSILTPATNQQPSTSKPVYLTIGRSQLSLLEMVKGSLKDAVVQLVFSLYELLDICVEDNTRRTLSILVGEWYAG